MTTHLHQPGWNRRMTNSGFEQPDEKFFPLPAVEPLCKLVNGLQKTHYRHTAHLPMKKRLKILTTECIEGSLSSASGQGVTLGRCSWCCARTCNVAKALDRNSVPGTKCWLHFSGSLKSVHSSCGVAMQPIHLLCHTTANITFCSPSASSPQRPSWRPPDLASSMTVKPCNNSHAGATLASA